MLAAYNEILRQADAAGSTSESVRLENEAHDCLVAWLSSRPTGPDDTLARLTVCRDLLVWEGESCVSATAVHAALAVAISALDNQSSDAASRLRALGKLNTSGELGAALEVIADVRLVVIIRTSTRRTK
jgi:hypothetical protein